MVSAWDDERYLPEIALWDLPRPVTLRQVINYLLLFELLRVAALEVNTWPAFIELLRQLRSFRI